MNNNKERLILEDYETGFNYGKTKSSINISFNRIAFIFFLFLIISSIFSIKVIYLGSLEIKVNLNLDKKSNFRSSILDREGNILSKSIITTNVGINPKSIINKEKLLINLKLIFPEKNFEEISKKIDADKFFYLEKTIRQEKYDKLFLLERSIKRIPLLPILSS